MIAVLLADGFEETEMIAPLDILRRAGLDAKTISIASKIVVGAHGIATVADLRADEVDEGSISLLILPGGMPGTLNLDASPTTDRLISAVIKNGGRLAAICAAPLILGRRGLLADHRAVCYPGFENELTGAIPDTRSVVTDGNITTAKGAGVALEFGAELVSLICGKEKSESILSAMMKV